MTNNNYNLNLSVSLKPYQSKEAIKEDIFNSSYKYMNLNFDLTKFKYGVQNGYCFCHNFNKKEFGLSDKTYKNFVSAKFIFIDIDKTSICMEQFYDMLSLKPTFAYTTYSNGKDDTFSFRLIYCFDDYITNRDDYNNIYMYLLKCAEADTHLINKDNCGSSCVQQMFGCYNCDMVSSDIVYSLNDISNEKCHSNGINKKRKETLYSLNGTSENKTNIEITDAEYMNDYWSMDYTTLLAKYKDIYPFFVHTPLPDVDEDTPYIMLPDNYIEVKRYWIKTTSLNALVKGKFELVPVKLKDGQGRKKKLYINGILRRYMVNNLPFEYLLNCLVNELYYYVNNAKDPINKKVLYGIACNAYKADLEAYRDKIDTKTDKRTFIVNEAYCAKYNVSKGTVRNETKQMLLFAEIGNLYDCLMTDKQNLEVMKQYGLNTSLRTLKRFKDFAGLTKKRDAKKCHSNCIIKKEKEHYTNRMALLEETTTAEYGYDWDVDYNEYNKLYNDNDIFKKMCKYEPIEEIDDKFNAFINYMNNQPKINTTINNNIETLEDMDTTMTTITNEYEANKAKLLADIKTLKNKIDHCATVEDVRGKMGKFDKWFGAKSSFLNEDDRGVIKNDWDKYCDSLIKALSSDNFVDWIDWLNAA